MRETLPEWSLRPLAHALMAMRGVQLIAAMTLVAELQDFLRFESPRKLMAFVGLVPGEHSSGLKRRQGSHGPSMDAPPAPPNTAAPTNIERWHLNVVLLQCRQLARLTSLREAPRRGSRAGDLLWS